MSKESKYPEPFDEFMRTAKRHLTWAERITVWSDETGKWVQHGTFDDPYEAIMPAAYFSRGGNAMMVMYGKMQQIDEARDNEPIGRPRRVRVSVLLRPTTSTPTSSLSKTRRARSRDRSK